MVDSSDLSQQSTDQADWVQLVGKNHRQVGPALGVVGLLLGVITLSLAIKYRGDLLWITIATLLPIVTTVLCGLWARFRPTGQLSDRDAGRLTVLAVGGLLGLDLLLISLAAAIQWWDQGGGGLLVWQGWP